MDLLVKSKLIKIIPDIVATRELRCNKKILFSSPSLRFGLNDVNYDKVVGFSREDMFALIIYQIGLPLAYNYKQNGFDYIVENIRFEIGAKKKLKENVFAIGDFLDFKLENKNIYIPFYIFLFNK